ncbi:MAG: hypothetical protein KF690_07145 [Bacteroidetes bacterium]|nr:hypothetical protein [Bacteroidota bacterium]
MKQSAEQLSDFVEEMGVLMERLHFSKMSGRILGWLLSAEQPHTSFDDLVAVLSASKSSISTNLKLLTELHFITPYTQHGDRKTYYRFNFAGFFEAWQERMNNTGTFRYLFQKAALLYPHGTDERALALAEQADFYTWLEKEQGKLFKLWQSRRKETAEPPPSPHQRVAAEEKPARQRKEAVTKPHTPEAGTTPAPSKQEPAKQAPEITLRSLFD